MHGVGRWGGGGGWWGAWDEVGGVHGAGLVGWVVVRFKGWGACSWGLWGDGGVHGVGGRSCRLTLSDSEIHLFCP